MKTKFFYGMAALATLGLTACSSEEPVNDTTLQQDEDRYLRIALMNPIGTRAEADDFDPGTGAENYVGSVIMDFYDAAGNFVARANPSDITWDKAQNVQDTNEDGTPKVDEDGNPVYKPEQPGNAGNVGKIGTGIVKISIEKSKNLPSYVMCFLNPVAWGGATQTVNNMHDLRLTTREAFKDGKGNFAMNNSCYYGQDEVTGQANVKISGTPIAAAKLYTTEADAKKAGAATVDIYVERYAAKVSFTAEIDAATGAFPEDKNTAKGVYPYTGSTTVGETDYAYSLQFHAEAWTVNADAPSMYAVKNFATLPNSGVPTLNEVNTYLGTWSTWNDPGNHRSYWSCSPAFFATAFPQVSDNIVDQKTDGSTGAGEVVGDFALKYYSYNQITGAGDNKGEKTFKAANADGTGLPTRYVLENTMGKPAFSSVNPKAAVPALLMVGNYTVTYNNQAVAPGTSFYLYNDEIFFASAPQTAAGEGEEATAIANAVLMKDKFIADQQVIYIAKDVPNPDYDATKKDQEGYNVPETIKQYSLLTKANAGSALDLFVVKHPTKEVREQQNVPMRFVTLQLTGPGTVLYYRPNGAGEYVQITTTNLDVVNRILWNQLNVAYSYNQGKCYYAMPIHHLGMTENTAASPINADGALSWDKLRIGDLGLVRNHTYKLAVQAINGLATGIDQLDYPIVPPADIDSYWISYKINILNWRIVPEQTGIIL